MDEIEDEHPDGDDNRYKSSAGWDPNRQRTKMDEREVLRRVKRAREEHLESEAARQAIDVRPASEWLDEADLPEPRRDLFPPFWHEGELAVLTGPPGVGKSLLAVQLAEAMASPVNSEKRKVNNDGLPSQTAPSLFTIHCSLFTPAERRVLLIDLARTPRQIAELHAGREFSENLEYGLLADVEMPESYNGRHDRFYLEAVKHRFAESEAPVVIIDNLSWLTRSGGAAELHSVMRSFRRWVNETGRSMLVLRHSREDIAMHDQPAAFEMADSIFALCRSTMGDNIRYVKLLRGGRFTTDNGQLKTDSSDPESGHFPLSTINFPLSEVLVLRTINERLEFSGVSPEELHLFDYAAHVKRVNRRLEHVDEHFSPRLSLGPEKRVNFLAITDGKPKKPGT